MDCGFAVRRHSTSLETLMQLCWRHLILFLFSWVSIRHLVRQSWVEAYQRVAKSRLSTNLNEFFKLVPQLIDWQWLNCWVIKFLLFWSIEFLQILWKLRFFSICLFLLDDLLLPIGPMPVPYNPVKYVLNKQLFGACIKTCKLGPGRYLHFWLSLIVIILVVAILIHFLPIDWNQNCNKITILFIFEICKIKATWLS